MENHVIGSAEVIFDAVEKLVSRLFFYFDVDSSLVSHLRRRVSLRGRLFVSLDAIFETLDGFTNIAAHVADLFGAEYQHYDDQYNQPVPNTK